MSCRGASRLEALDLAGPAGRIEALLQECDSGPPLFAALVCHPHPLHGGTLNNKVVHRVASTMHDLGGTTLRFNFRGVGRSAGRFDGGVGELEDARAALGWLRERLPGAALRVAGFSFGAWVAARLAASEPAVGGLVLIGPPVAGADFASMRTATVPKLVIQGTSDELCPLSALTPEFATWAGPRRLETIEGATHFFDRRLGDLEKALREGMRGWP
jgi:uncharacterized protein